MREDIAKKLCERPRFGGGGKYQLRSERRKAKNERNWDSLPKKESMKRPNIKGWNGKYLNEYFPPLLGFLKKNVGRPWDKVFSEICQYLNPTSTVQKHVFDHLLRDFVETKPFFKKGSKIPYRSDFAYSNRGANDGLYEVRSFYVDPHGLLKDNDGDKARKRRARERKKGLRQDVRVPINDMEEYRRINGLWFHVWYKHLRTGQRGYDVILRKEIQVSRYGSWELERSNGKAMFKGKPMSQRFDTGFDYYRIAVDKKQVSKKEIRLEGLNKL